MQALNYLYKQFKIIHRDIKPANIVFTNENDLILKLIDLGVSIELQQEYLTE